MTPENKKRKSIEMKTSELSTEELHALWDDYHRRAAIQFRASEQERFRLIREDEERRRLEKIEADRHYREVILPARELAKQREHQRLVEYVRKNYGGDFKAFDRDQFSYSF